jgi:hypothetical protein
MAGPLSISSRDKLTLRTNNLDDSLSPEATYDWEFGTDGGLTVPGSIIPDADVAYDLGSPTAKFRSLYISSSTIYIGENAVSMSDSGKLLVNGASAVSAFEKFVGETLVTWTGPESDPVGSSITEWRGSKLIILNPGARYKQGLYDLKVGSVIRADYPTMFTPPIPSKEWTVVGNLEEYPSTITVGLTPIPVKRFEIEISENTTATGSAINYPEFIYLPVMEKSATIANGTWTVSISAEGGIVFPSGSTVSISDTGQMLVNGNDPISKLEYFGGEGNGPRDAGSIAWNTSTFTFNVPGKELVTAIYDLKPGNKIRAANTIGLNREFTIVGNAREYIRDGGYQMAAIDVAETTSTNVFAYSLYLPVKDKSATIANGTWTVTVSTTGTIVYPDGTQQSGASISVAQLKTLVAASTDFADFKSRIAAL